MEKLFEDKNDYSKENIYARVSLLDRVYSTRLNDYDTGSTVSINRMVMHIVNNAKSLKNCFESDDSFDAVKEIMSVSFDPDSGEKKYKNVYSFASKYCSFMNPDKYPIYDSTIREALRELNPKYIISTLGSKTSAQLTELKDRYDKFRNIVEDIRKNKILGDLYCIRDIDKILWMSKKENKKE